MKFTKSFNYKYSPQRGDVSMVAWADMAKGWYSPQRGDVSTFLLTAYLIASYSPQRGDVSK